MLQRAVSRFQLAPKTSVQRLLLGIVGATLIAVTAVVSWCCFGDSGESPESRLQRALLKLDQPDDPAAWEAARRTAVRLRRDGFRDPNFPGATELILGTVAARALELGPPNGSGASAAVKHLEDAEKHGLEESRRPEWAFTLGAMHVKLGQAEAARGLLREAWAALHRHRTAAGLLLAELELANPVADSRDRVEGILEDLSANAGLSGDQRRQMNLQRARLALLEGHLDDAESALSELSETEREQVDAALLASQLDLARHKLDDARRRLYPIVFETSPTLSTARLAAAAHLLGQCDEQRGEASAAARAYERAADVAPGTFDGTIAAMSAARLLQRAGRDEEALRLFHSAIDSQSRRSPPPVPVERFRQAIREGWNVWIDRNEFDSAIELAAAAAKILTRSECFELHAKASEKAALETETAWESANESVRESLREKRLAQWRRSGEAYLKLSETLTDGSRSGVALATAADHFGKAQAYREAESALTSLLTLNVATLEPTTLLQRGKARLNLGKPAEAVADLNDVLQRFPTDPAAFEARFLLGNCYLDAGKEADAEVVWRELLALPDLSPDAVEWRNALFALAKMLYQRGAVTAIRESESADSGFEAAILPLDEAIARFGEFLRRAPDAPQAVEARVLRADAMQRRAGLSLLVAANAETENLREANQREATILLEGAVAELRNVQETLASRSSLDRLTRLEQEFLKASFFNIGHAYSALRRDREAIIAYGAAMNRYPDDCRIIGAYVRIAECHRRLGRNQEARAAIEQARLLLAQFPESAFDSPNSALSRSDWQSWLERLSNDTVTTQIP